MFIDKAFIDVKRNYALVVIPDIKAVLQYSPAFGWFESKITYREALFRDLTIVNSLDIPGIEIKLSVEVKNV